MQNVQRNRTRKVSAGRIVACTVPGWWEGIAARVRERSVSKELRERSSQMTDAMAKAQRTGSGSRGGRGVEGMLRSLSRFWCERTDAHPFTQQSERR